MKNRLSSATVRPLRRLVLAGIPAVVVLVGMSACQPATQTASAYFRNVPGGEAKASCIINRESGGNPRAISATQDYGLFQINRAAHKAQFERLFGAPFEQRALDPKLNARYARYLYDYYVSHGRSGWTPWNGGRYAC